MNKKKNLQMILFFCLIQALFIFTGMSMTAETVGSSDWGYALDLPEGFSLADSNGSTRFRFSNSLYPVMLQIALYPRTQFSKADDALSFVTNQFKSTGHEVSFEWRRRMAAIGHIESDIYGGWTVSLELAKRKGWLVLACYTETDRATELEPLIISSLDAVFTDEGSWFEPGPMTTFAWKKGKDITATYDDGTQKLEVPFNSVDAEANQSVVDREFALLTSYLDTSFVYAAWKRYYRLIYRDAWARLTKPSFIIENKLPADPHDLATAILSWTQSFNYERNFNGSDFTNLPEAFATKTGDCDSRALLMVLLLNQMGVDAILLVSPEYSHAVAAVDCPGKGARYAIGDKQYLIADTTAKVDLGLIAEDMADSAKWFYVTFYAFPQKDQ